MEKKPVCSKFIQHIFKPNEDTCCECYNPKSDHVNLPTSQIKAKNIPPTPIARTLPRNQPQQPSPLTPRKQSPVGSHTEIQQNSISASATAQQFPAENQKQKQPPPVTPRKQPPVQPQEKCCNTTVEDGYAYNAGLRNEDRLIEINVQDVKSMSDAECAQLPRDSVDTLIVKVIDVPEQTTDNSLPIQKYATNTINLAITNRTVDANIPDFLKSNCCVYSIKDEYNDSSIIQCFEILKPYCQNREDPLDITFNTIVDEPLDINLFSKILCDQTSPANRLTPYIVDSLKRHHSLNDIINLSSEVLDTLENNTIDIIKYETLVDQLTKRLLLIQTLENMSYDSQRFLCNFIRKNDLPIPLSYRVWNWKEKTMYYRINFNCLMETLCLTDLRLILQFGSPSTSGHGKTSLIGYLFDDKRRESFFTNTNDRSWRDGCIDVVFSHQHTVFDVHGKVKDVKLIRSIQPYAYVQILYITENDFQGDFLQANIISNIRTIVVIFDSNYDDFNASTQLIKRFEEKFNQWNNIYWTSAPMYNTSNNVQERKLIQRNKRLRETFNNLFKKIETNSEEKFFQSCFQIQSSFYETNSNLISFKLVFEIEKELNRLFSSLSDQTENFRLITPISYQRSLSFEKNLSNSIRNDFLQINPTSNIINEYHSFTISLLINRTYIEVLMVEIYLEKWRAAYVPKLRQEQILLRENTSSILRQLKQVERENPTSSERQNLNQQYEILRNQLKNVENRLMNVDLTFGLFCDELFALWDYIHPTQSNQEIRKLENLFEGVASKLSELVYKGFALHVLRGRPLQSRSRLLRMCIEKLNLRDSTTVLTVIGEQSSAKSSLLNATFGCNFRVSAGRCTIGLYLGLAYYKRMAIMILDTEGLMALEESGSIFDNQMVTMAVLASNLVILNHKGEISSSLEGLIGISLYAKIQIQSSPFKPKLLFVLRDQTQRDMKIFQQQLNRLKDNIQTNGEFLRMSIDDELEMKHIILMPGAFTEDTNRDYGIVQKWRTETFALEINKLRSTIFESLEIQMNSFENRRNLSKSFNTYLYLKLTTNWKSIDDLGEGLLRCQSLYELSVQNELKAIAISIILERQNQIQINGNQLIEKIIHTDTQQIQTTNGLKPHTWVQQIVKQGATHLDELIDIQIDEAEIEYNEKTQQAYFSKVKSAWKSIKSSIKTMRQYLYEQLEIRALETALKSNHDYYRRDLFNIKETSQTSEECIKQINQRVKELQIEIPHYLESYKRKKEDIIKSILDVYKNVIQTKTSKSNRRNTYSICPPLDYDKYLQNEEELKQIINKYVSPYVKRISQKKFSFSMNEPASPSPSNTTRDKQDDRSIYKWFMNSNDLMKNKRILDFVFDELLTRINNRLDKSPLHLAYSDPKLVDELIEIIDYELNISKIDMKDLHRPSFIQDIIIFMLFLLYEKTNQRFEEKNQQLLTETLNNLDQVKQNLFDQIEEEEKIASQGKFFFRILGKQIIQEIGRLQRQTTIDEIRIKFQQYYYSINDTNITQKIYLNSIQSSTINPTNILKLIFDPNAYCFEEIYLIMKFIFEQFIKFYPDEISTKFTGCLLIMQDVVLNSTTNDTYKLHNEVVKQISHILPGFYSANTIEIEREIKDSERFREYFKNFRLNEGVKDGVLVEELTRVQKEFRISVSIQELFGSFINQTIGCTSRCPGCGIKCELAAKTDSFEEHHHYSSYHFPMAFNGWPRNDQLHPNLSMCYQKWTEKVLFLGDGIMSTPQEFFYLEAPDWYQDIKEKSEKGEGYGGHYPLEEHRRAWMAVRYKLLKEFDLRDQETYHTGVYPMTIVSIPNDFEILWESL